MAAPDIARDDVGARANPQHPDAPASERAAADAEGPMGPSSRLPFMGWWTLFAVFVVMVTTSGFAFYGQGVFINALKEEQGFSVGIASLGTTLFFLSSGFAGRYAGELISRFDARLVITAGAVLSGAGIALLGEVRAAWQMLGTNVLFGTGFALAGLVPATTVITRWFNRKRSITLAVASSGLSLGAVLITNQMGASIDAASLEDRAFAFAVIYLLMMVPIVLLVLKPSPEALGQYPDGEKPVAGAAPPPPDGWDYEAAVSTRFFKVVSGAYFLVMAAQVGAIQLLYTLVAERIDTEAARVALALLTGTSVIARITGGIAATRISLTRLILLLVGVQAIGIAIVAVSFDRSGLYLGSIVLGTAIGNLLMLHPLLLAQEFGVKDYPRIYGLGNLFMIFGVAAGPYLVGSLRDAYSFRFAFLAMAALAILGGLVFSTAGSPDDTAAGRRRRNPLAPNVFQVVHQ